MKACSLCIAMLLVLSSLAGCPTPGGDNGGGSPATYTVTYNGNGSTTGTVPKDSTTYASGSMVTVLGNPGTLAKDGYSFNGWNTQADGNGTTYTQGETCSIGSANLTLYAKWTSLPTYSVTYNANQATGGTAPVDTTRYLPAQKVTVLANSGSLTGTGMAFTGWNTQQDGHGTSYAPGDSFAMGSVDVTLYAVMAPAYTVTYNANTTGTTGNVPIDSTNYLPGATVTVLGSGYLAKSGYIIIGWNALADGNGTTYNAQNPTFIMGSSNVTLYAMWAPAYTVTYNGNGSTGGNYVPTDPNKYLQNATVTVLGNVGSLTRSGYAFTGWNTQADGNGTPYSAGNTFAMGSANVTLYAQWIALIVTYDGNSSTSGSVPVDPDTHMTGWGVTVLGNTGNLARGGYTFIGWCMRADGSGTVYLPGQSFVMGSSPVTLYAAWTNLPTYRVAYIGNGNTGGLPPNDPNNYLPGTRVTVLAMNGLVNTGYNYAGWSTQADGSGTSYYQDQTFIMGSANVTLFAAWYTAGVSLTPVNGNTAYSVTAGTATSGNVIIPSYLFGRPVISIGTSAFYGCSGLTGVTIPNGITSIGNYAFRGCSGLTSLTLPNSVTSIGTEAFLGCSGLTSLTIPGSVTAIGISAFTSCTGLTSLTIPSSLSSIEGAFQGCTGLTSVTIPNGVTSIAGAFSTCTRLTDVTIPNSVTNMNGALSACTSLTSVTIPSSVTSIDSAFWKCTGLTSVTLPSSLNSTGNYTFAGCTNLTNVTIPNGIASIGQHTFDGCTSLAGLTIPGSVTSIADNAFLGCSAFTSVTIPGGVTFIGTNAFSNCTGLGSVVVNSATPPGSDNGYWFVGCPAFNAIKVPPASVIAYQNAQYWNYYAQWVVSQ